MITIEIVTTDHLLAGIYAIGAVLTWDDNTLIGVSEPTNKGE